jgi:bifunctional non-homologous end joining protein LigD
LPSLVLDGEVVCLDGEGRPQFNDLLFHRGTPVFVAFDVLAIGRRDVRKVPLLRRKALLRRVLISRSSSELYSDHVSGAGSDLFDAVCARDLEGIVAKWKHGAYAEPSSWIKIKNRAYTGARARHELMRGR